MKPRTAAGTLVSLAFAIASTFASPAAAGIVKAVEYFHPAFEHYFVTADPAEIAALDTGAVAGWWRTGQRYRVDDAPAPDLVPVCRFYTSAYASKPSHFFTASVADCEFVKGMPDWTYEGVAFYARLPDAQGNCAAGTAAIHRLYNAGHGGAPNHAYTADPAKVATLATAGWAAEGVAFCAPLREDDALEKTMMLAGSTWNFPSTALYDNLRIHTQFAHAATTGDEVNWRLSTFGLPPQAAAIHHQINDAWTGLAAWDALAGEYVAVGGSGFEGNGYSGDAWTFENGERPAALVCSYTVVANVLSIQPYTLHPFQPYRWSGCEPGLAYRTPDRPFGGGDGYPDP